MERGNWEKISFEEREHEKAKTWKGNENKKHTLKSVENE